MATNEYKWPQTLLVAGIGGFGVWCIAMLSNFLINILLPVRVPLWSTTILALMLVTYWFTGAAENRIESLLKKKRKVAGFAEDPNFEIGDPRRELSKQFYSAKAAAKWVQAQKGNGAINASIRDVTVNDSNGELVFPAPYTSMRVKLTIGYVFAVLVVAVLVKVFVETAFPDRELHGSDVRREIYRRFPLWASMILSWVLLAHAELREIAAREHER